MSDEKWVFPHWEEIDGEPGFWRLMQGYELVGEAYPINHGNGWRWHCKTSDWRDSSALSVEQAKAECECSFWKEAWHVATNVYPPSPAIEPRR